MRSVLIVDDDTKLCEMLRGYFACHDIEVSVRHDGESGLEEVGQRSYDLMLLDVMLPGMDGFEVLRRLRELSNVCVLLLTARGDSADRAYGLGDLAKAIEAEVSVKLDTSASFSACLQPQKIQV